MKINVSNQHELINIIDKPDISEIIIRNASENISITHTPPCEFIVEDSNVTFICDSVKAYIFGNSKVVLWGKNNDIELYGNSKLKALRDHNLSLSVYDNASAIITGAGEVDCYGGASVNLSGHFLASTYSNSRASLVCYGHSYVNVNGRSKVLAYGNTVVNIGENFYQSARAKPAIIAYDDSEVNIDAGQIKHPVCKLYDRSSLHIDIESEGFPWDDELNESEKPYRIERRPVRSYSTLPNYLIPNLSKRRNCDVELAPDDFEEEWD